MPFSNAPYRCLPVQCLQINPSLHVLKKLAKALKVTLAELVE